MELKLEPGDLETLADLIAEKLHQRAAATPSKVGVNGKEACRMLGISSTQLAKLRRSGRIRATRHGKAYVYMADDLPKAIEG